MDRKGGLEREGSIGEDEGGEGEEERKKECGAFYQYLSRSVQQCMHARTNVRPFQGRS
jgi:hypothetical protein